MNSREKNDTGWLALARSWRLPGNLAAFDTLGTILIAYWVARYWSIPAEQILAITAVAYVTFHLAFDVSSPFTDAWRSLF